MKAPNNNFPKEIWLRKDYLLQQASSLWNAEQYDDDDVRYIQADKANDLIRELVDALRTEYYDREYDIGTGHEIHRTNKQADQALRNAKEFLK